MSRPRFTRFAAIDWSGQAVARPKGLALAVAEESGQLVESMGRLSRRYEEEAESAVKTLATIFGFLIALLVMTLITLMIFRIASFYLGTINEALEMTR